MNKYTFTVEAENPPKVFLNDVIPNVGKVIELKAEVLPAIIAWMENHIYPFAFSTEASSTRC